MVVQGAGGMRPATREILDGIRAAGTPEVVVLPHDKDSVPSAEAAAEQARSDGLRVQVLPTRASVQVLAALAVHDPQRRFDDDVVSMTAAARATRYGGVTTAVREALTTAGVCHPGDQLGVVSGDVAVIGSDLNQVAAEVLDRLLSGGGELVTLVDRRRRAGRVGRPRARPPPHGPPRVGHGGLHRRAAALPAALRRRVTAQPGPAGRRLRAGPLGGRGADRQDPRARSGHRDGRRPDRPLPAAVRAAGPAHRPGPAGHQRAGDGPGPGGVGQACTR